MTKDMKMQNGAMVMKDGDTMAMDGTMMNASDCKTNTAMMHDGVMMKDGEMTVVTDGKCSAMKAEMKMKDGTRIMKDGSVVKPDGQKLMMKNGDMMSMDGTMMAGM
jgi:hypothetical protein